MQNPFKYFDVSKLVTFSFIVIVATIIICISTFKPNDQECTQTSACQKSDSCYSECDTLSDCKSECDTLSECKSECQPK
jgi:hypothetical protein